MLSHSTHRCVDCGRDAVKQRGLCPECVRDHAGISQLLVCAAALLLVATAFLVMAASAGW
jgi:hypothetical protein